MGMIPRIVLSIVVIGIFAVVNVDTNAIATIASANFAGMQFDNSDTSAVAAQAGMQHISLLLGLVDIALIASLVVIWWSTFKGESSNA